jgi:hypothetical protein
VGRPAPHGLYRPPDRDAAHDGPAAKEHPSEALFALERVVVTEINGRDPVFRRMESSADTFKGLSC